MNRYIISFPNSGESNINNLIYLYCLNNNNIKYSSCNYYTCCKSIICKKKSLIMNNHDFNLNLVISPFNKYLVLFCNDPYLQLQNYDNIKKNITYYSGFIEKWIKNAYPNVMVIDIIDLFIDINISNKIIKFFFGNNSNLIENLNNFNITDFNIFSKDYYHNLKSIVKNNKELNNILKSSYNKYYLANSYNLINSNKNNYTAIIIEPRKHQALELVLNNFVLNLDSNWKFIIYHGIDNEEYVINIVKYIENKYNKKIFRLINLNVTNLTFDDYNKLFYNINFYNNIDTEMFLIFQTDTLISQIYSKLIYNFMEYDYVGAPWNNEGVGNGGLSLRRKSKMLEILNYLDEKNILNENGTIINEDIIFSNSEEIFLLPIINKNIKLNKPSFEESKFFSVEMIYNNMSFGIHKPWLYLSDEELNKLKDYIPDLNILMDCQSSI